jgi:hypothetical protein
VGAEIKKTIFVASGKRYLPAALVFMRLCGPPKLFSFFEKKLLTRNQACEIVIPDRRHYANDENEKPNQKMNITATTEISIGSKKYDVGISKFRRWESSNGMVREYIEIGKPGISEIANAYIAITPATPRSCDEVVQTALGTIIWAPIAGGVTGAKKTAIKIWFEEIATLISANSKAA